MSWLCVTEQRGWHRMETRCQGKHQPWCTGCFWHSARLSHISHQITLVLSRQIYCFDRTNCFLSSSRLIPPAPLTRALIEFTPRFWLPWQWVTLKAAEFFSTTMNSERFNQSTCFSHGRERHFAMTHWLEFSKLSQYELVIELQPETKINWARRCICFFLHPRMLICQTVKSFGKNILIMCMAFT